MSAHDPLDDWHYDLPDDRIARRPADPRDASRLLVLPLDGGPPRHRIFRELGAELRAGDLLVVNDTRVVPARLVGRRATGGQAELLVLSFDDRVATALARPARKLRPGDRVTLPDGTEVEIRGPGDAPGEVILGFPEDPDAVLERVGRVPLPPYLGREDDAEDRARYQTVYAGSPGSAAAPTAGLHFTERLLDELTAAGVGLAQVTLHVGLGTFKAITAEDVARGTLHAETWAVPHDTAAAVARTRAAGGRVVAVGTTTVRTLESATPPGARNPEPGSGSTELFLAPPARLRAVDALITNFHLPRSSLLMLVACLCGRERLLRTYEHARDAGYRFTSYGDAMLLL
jgi:S-adenosylmethionine:tRNA ribosyltransferase-isomerase